MNRYPPTRRTNTRLRFTGLALLMVVAMFAFGVSATEAQVNVSFNSSGLAGENLNNPTSLQFGPDGRLYVSQQNGLIYAYTIEREAANDYVVTATEQINIVQQFIPNHDDDGNPASQSANSRQVTGIYVAGTGVNPILYVSSSDSRIGAGGGGTDKNLDTNSGVVSRLTCNRIDLTTSCNWDKVDLVRGLPRSEENHSVNGMQLQGDKLYLAIGGLANAGAPSNNFAFITDYYYSSAIVVIDLAKIDAMDIQVETYKNSPYKYVFDMPTLDDPTRENLPDGSDPGDPFGGNDGLNQAKHDPTGTVSIHSPGWRNLYDIVITENGRMYGVDNGANANWGGHPAFEADYPVDTNGGDTSTPGQCTNDYISGEPGSVDVNNSASGVGPGNDDKVNNKNGLHYIRPLESGDFNYVAADDGAPYYGGHPVPTRGNPVGAGLYTKGTHTVDPVEGDDDYWRNQILPENDPNFSTASLPVDWPPAPRDENGNVIANPIECDFRNSGQDDNSIANYGPSTNGIAEYTASNFNGAMQGNLLLAAFNGNIYEVELSEDGKVAENCPTPPQNGTSTLANCNSSFANNFGATPLDVIAQGDNDIFGGTVWAATYGADNITIFEPADYNGQDVAVCIGDPSETLDEDGDTYTNSDEIANGTDQCSGASVPPDFDQAFEFGDQDQFRRSNLLDDDDDNDGLKDFGDLASVDRFPQDCSNGIAGTCQTSAQPPQTLVVPAELEFFQATGYGLVASIGFTGVMTNGDDYLTLLDHLDGDNRIVAGGTAGILTDPIVQDGTADGNVNDQLNGFQFALDVDSTNAPYSVESSILGSFFGATEGTPNTATDSQAAGIFIGTGDQDNFFKLVVRNSEQNDGLLAFEAYLESGGTQVASIVEDAPSGASTAEAITLYISVNPANGTIQPQYTITDNGVTTERTSIGSPISLPANSDILKVVQGTYTVAGKQSGLAAGVIATSLDTQPYGFSWDYIYANENPSAAKAFVEVDTGGINSSTFGNGSFNIRNDSTDGIEIEKVTIDLESALISEVVFDPNGTAGDNVGKGFTDNNGSATTTGVVNSTFGKAYEGGFYSLEITFDDFGAGELLQFGADIDPISTKNAPQPGPNDSASVSGLELAGSVVTVEFSNGDTHVVELYRKQPDSVGGSNNIVRNQLPAAPNTEMVNVSNQATVFTASQQVNVLTNALTQEVKLLQFEAGQFKQPNGGYSIDPFEINSIVAINEYEGNTDNGTSVTFNVTLTNQQPDDEEYGYNVFAAVAVDSDGATSPLSDPIIVKYDPNAVPDFDLRVNAGGDGFTDTDGNTWQADQFFVNGAVYPNGGPSSNTIDVSDPLATDQLLYQTERFNANLQYEIDVTPGVYNVELHFAELYFGLPGAGSAGGPSSRVFDVIVEGETKIAGYDIAAVEGPGVAAVKVYVGVEVTDGSLSLNFPASANNAKISGFRVYGNSDPNAEIPINLAAIADQIDVEGTQPAVAIAATGGDGNKQYAATGLPTGLGVEPTNGQIVGTIAEGASTGGPNSDGIYTVTVTVDDSDDNDADIQTTTFTWTVTPPPTGGDVLYRVNVGGPQLAAPDNSDPAWSADNGANPSLYLTQGGLLNNGNPAIYNGGSGTAHSGEITPDNTVPAYAPLAMLNTERYDPPTEPEMMWQFPVDGGEDVIVRLFFAELFGQITAPGERVFSVSVEGEVPTPFADIDPFATAGAKGAFMLEAPATVSEDGTLDIEFIHNVENPAVKGIEIVLAEDLDSPVNTPPVFGGFFPVEVESGNPIAVPITATDADNDPLQFTISITDNDGGATVDPANYTFTDNGDGSADLTWNNAPVGTYTAMVMVTDSQSPVVSANFGIIVTEPQQTTLNGTLSIQSRSDNSADVTVKMYQNNQMVTEATVTAASNGEFTVPDVTPGTYDIYVKTPTTLATVQTVTMTSGSNPVDFGEMLNGDANNNNVVEILDFTILATAFNQSTGDTFYFAGADFNGNGAVEILDFTILAANFSEKGAEASTE